MTPVRRDMTGKIAGATPPAWLGTTGSVLFTDTIPVGTTSAYRCVLDDGSGQLDLLFLGRVGVPGLMAGAHCSVFGRVAWHADRLSMWNPRYRLEPAPPDADPPKPDPPAAARPARVEQPATPEPVAAAGHFRVYLGMAAGVGKTYAMLDEAHRRAARGCDVVVGIVDTHGRKATAAQLSGLETLPRKSITYRGAHFEELDVDAILARRPELVLIDELAHTNVPGAGRHEKRWQDVVELLEADISVITTVNAQHIESLADVVADITGTPVRERVPDAMLRDADQIELVDSSPEQLRRRMLHGNIYPPARIHEALNGFFQTQNLTALRELTLRFLADETDDELLDQLHRTRPAHTWDTAERVVVGVTAQPGTEEVVRRAGRIAQRLNADMHVVHVQPADGRRRPPADSLEPVRQLAQRLGAHWIELDDDDPASAIMRVAAEHQATQIVLGPSRRTRWPELFAGRSTVRRLTRLAGTAGIDVHIIARPEPGSHCAQPGAEPETVPRHHRD